MIEDPPAPPAGLRTHGRRLWESIVTVFVLTPAELTILVEFCRTRDELDRLEAAVRKLPDLVTAGSRGQVIPHPLLAELRSHRLVLERLAGALNLPDEGENVGMRGPSRHAQRAVRARWRQVRDGKGSVDGDAEVATVS